MKWNTNKNSEIVEEKHYFTYKCKKSDIFCHILYIIFSFKVSFILLGSKKAFIYELFEG